MILQVEFQVAMWIFPSIKAELQLFLVACEFFSEICPLDTFLKSCILEVGYFLLVKAENLTL